MKRFIIVFILLFVGFSVANAETKLLTAHPSERCVIYQCDSITEINTLLKKEVLRFTTVSYYAYSRNEHYTFDASLENVFHVYIYETSNGKTDWRVSSYGRNNIVGLWLNKDMNGIWNKYEKIINIDAFRLDYWSKQDNDIIPVYCEVDDVHFREPRPNFIGVGNSSFIHDIITEAGGTNILSDVDDTYGYIDEELIINRAPEIIFLLKSGNITVQDIKNRKEWENIPAVKNNRIYVIDDIPHSFLDIVQSTMTKQIQEAIKEYKK